MGEQLRRVMESWKELLNPKDLDPADPDPVSLNPEAFKEPYRPRRYTVNDAARELRQLMGEGSTIFGRRLRCSADSILQFEKDEKGLRPPVLERMEALAREKFPDHKDMIYALSEGAACARGRAMQGGWWHDPGEHSECTNAYEDPIPQPKPHHPTRSQAATLLSQAELLMNSPAWKGRLKEIKRLCGSYEKAGEVLEWMKQSPIRDSIRKLGWLGAHTFPCDEMDLFVADWQNPDVNLGVEIKPPRQNPTHTSSADMQPEPWNIKSRTQRTPEHEARMRAIQLALGRQGIPESGPILLSPGEACKALREWMEEGLVKFSRRVGIEIMSISRFENGKRSLRPVALERLLALAHEKLPPNTSVSDQIIPPLSWAVIGAWKRVEEHGGWSGDSKPKPDPPIFHFLTKLQLQSFRSNLHLSVDAFPWRARLAGLKRLCESYFRAADILEGFRDGSVEDIVDSEITEPYSIPWDEVTAFVHDYRSLDPELGLAVGVVVDSKTGEPVPPRQRRDTPED